MKDLYDSVMSGIISRIDDHIDKLNDQKDAAVDALEAEKEAAEKALEAQRDSAIKAIEAERDARISALEDEKEAIQYQIDLIQSQINSKNEEIEAIQDAADATKRQADYEQNLYNQRRAQEQKVNKVYSGQDRGFIYEADTSAIREADEAVEDSQREIRIANIEEEVKTLEKRRDALEDQGDLIDEQIDELDKYYDELIDNTNAYYDELVESSNAYYDNLIASTEAYWNQMIQSFEETKSRWQELQDLEEQAEFEANLRELGLTMDDVLNKSSKFEAFKSNYLNLLTDIHAGNDQMIASLSELANVDMSALPGYLEQTQQYIDMLNEGIDFSNLSESLSSTITGFENAATAAGILTGAITGGSSGNSEEGSAEGQGKEGEGSGSSGVVPGLTQMGEVGVEQAGKVTEALAGDENSVASGATIAKEAIVGGGTEKGKGKGDSQEGAGSLTDAYTMSTEAALDPETGLPAQIDKWGELNEVLGRVIENLDEIREKLEALSTMEVSIPSVSYGSYGGYSHYEGTVNNPSKIGNSYDSGSYGIPSREHNALVSEFGPEIAVYPNGTYKLFTEPSIVDLPQGTAIFNTRQTLDILKRDKHISLGGTALFDGYDVGTIDHMRDIVSSHVADKTGELRMGEYDVPVSNQNTTVNLNGGIVLQGVQNVDELAKGIVQKLPLKMMQIMNRKEFRPRK